MEPILCTIAINTAIRVVYMIAIGFVYGTIVVVMTIKSVPISVVTNMAEILVLIVY